MAFWVIVPTLMITGTIVSILGSRRRASQSGRGIDSDGYNRQSRSPNAVQQHPITVAAKERNMAISMDIQEIDTSVSITNSSGNLARSLLVKSLDYIIKEHGTGEDGTYPRYDSVIVRVDYDSVNPFTVVPAMLLTEHSATFTNTENSTSDPQVVIADSLSGGDFMVDFGPMVFGNKIQDNGSAHFVARQTLDITEFCNAYSEKFARGEINENTSSIPNLDLVISCQTTDNASVVSLAGQIVLSFHHKRQDTF